MTPAYTLKTNKKCTNCAMTNLVNFKNDFARKNCGIWFEKKLFIVKQVFKVFLTAV